VAAGWVPTVRRKAKVAPGGADQASEMLVRVMQVTCSDDADGARLKRTVIWTGRLAVTDTVW